MDNKDIDRKWVSWLNLITSSKIKYEIMPDEPSLNLHWKLIPGYNGIKINVVKSLNNLELSGNWDESCLVFEEFEPHLKLYEYNFAPIYSGNSNKPMVTLILNVAWGNEYLEELLSIFKKSKVKSTFFLDGSWVNRYPLLARAIIDDGHEIGSHAYSHPNMKELDSENIISELQKTNDIILKELGLKPTLFTPPFAELDERVIYWAAKEKMYTILYSIDTIDWQSPEPITIIEKVKSQLANASIILMHPTKTTLCALPGILDVINEKNYKIGTVSELISSKRV